MSNFHSFPGWADNGHNDEHLPLHLLDINTIPKFLENRSQRYEWILDINVTGVMIRMF